ncbi:MAG: hypothetical protein WC326_05670 [Candidatus Delongbacteria bacterium]
MKHGNRTAGRWWWILLPPLLLCSCAAYLNQDATRQFAARPADISLTVFPVHVVKGGKLDHDEALARRVAEFLRAEKLAQPTVVATLVEIPVRWRHNQAKMAQTSARAFAQHVKETGLQTDYALLGEILCTPDERVIGVHYFVCDRAGRLANGGLTNSHWEEFQTVKPANRQDGCEVLTRMLQRIWQEDKPDS